LWTHKSYITDSEYLVRADYIAVSYVLAEVEGRLFRFDKVRFENLSISCSGIGWIVVDVQKGGTPGMAYSIIHPEEEGKTIFMSLYRAGQEFTKDDYATRTVADIPSVMSPQLSVVLGEIIGCL
jgi:hypothetical protein